jgi:hypothetical protein
MALRDFDRLCAADPGGTRVNRIVNDVEGMIVEKRSKFIDLDGRKQSEDNSNGVFTLYSAPGSPGIDDPFLTGNSYGFVEFTKGKDSLPYSGPNYSLISDGGMYRVFLNRQIDGKCHGFSFSIEQFLRRSGHDCAAAIKVDRFQAHYKVTFSTTEYRRSSDPEESIEKLERTVTDGRTGEILAQSSFLRLGWVDLLPDQFVTNVMFYDNRGRLRERTCPAIAPLDIRSVLVPRR